MHKSIIQNLDNKKCYICGREGIVEQHHCLHGSSRRKADADGLVVNLCIYCHRRLHDKGENDEALKRKAQAVWMRYNDATAEEFIARYGKGWL